MEETVISDTGRTRDSVKIISDVFSGADGGVGYVCFCSFMKDMSERAENGDKAAEEIENVVMRFARLVKLSMGKL